MMRIIKVNLKERSYNIIIGWDILPRLSGMLKKLNVPKDLFIITNKNIKSLCAAALKKSLARGGFSLRFYSALDSEKAKSIGSAFRLSAHLAAYAGEKKIAVVAFGGGVIGDLSGFIASVYKRGVPFIQVPTTLLAQIDSSIGGKTAIDLPIAKNILGTFYQPKVVICNLSFLKTLDKKELRAALAEAIKYAIIKDEKLFGFLENNYFRVLACEPKVLEHLVYECVKIKAEIVGVDETEKKGIRTILNFGHTIGHAIEAAGKYAKYSHGEALSLGMLCAAKMSLDMKMMDRGGYQRIADLIAVVGLPEKIIGIKESQILKAYKLDKKFRGRTNRFVLLKSIGRPLIRENIPEKIITGALRELES